MKIEFQLTLADWIEWKRANLSKRRLALLTLAETSVIPLIIIFALTIVLAWLRFVPGWLAIVMLSLIALAQVYLSWLSRFRRHTLKQDWLNKVADQIFTLETNANGFDYSSTKVSYKPTWPEVASVYQTKRLLMFCDSDTSDTCVLLVPKHAFASKEQLDEFLELAYQKTVADRHVPEIAASA